MCDGTILTTQYKVFYIDAEGKEHYHSFERDVKDLAQTLGRFAAKLENRSIDQDVINLRIERLENSDIETIEFKTKGINLSV